MDLDGIMLSEVSQTEKDKYHMISLIWGIQKNKTYREQIGSCQRGGVLGCGRMGEGGVQEVQTKTNTI